MPDPQLLTRGKASGAAIGGGGGTVDFFIETSGMSTLILEVDMSGAIAGDLGVQVNPVSEQGDEILPIAQPSVQSVGPTFSGGRVYFWASWDVQAQNRVRVRITNNNAGAQNVDYAWRAV